MTDPKPVYLPTQLVVLWILAAGGIGLGIILGAFQLNLADKYGTSASQIVALATWSNFLLVVGVIAMVGALVLSGARDMLRR